MPRPTKKRGVDWYKCDPAAFNDGMTGLTLEQRGAYTTLINAMYAGGGPVRDDDAYWCAICHCKPKAWSAAKAALITRGRLRAIEVSGKACLIDDRVERTLADYATHRESMAALSEKGVTARQERRQAAKRAENEAATVSVPHGNRAVQDRSPDGDPAVTAGVPE